jgi:hypothetical protein
MIFLSSSEREELGFASGNNRGARNEFGKNTISSFDAKG